MTDIGVLPSTPEYTDIATGAMVHAGQTRGRTSWIRAEEVTPEWRASEPTTNAKLDPALYKWGPVEWRVWPLNTHEVDVETATDWAHKEIAGAAIYREWVGENDEMLYMRGHIYPYRIGGMSQLEAFEAQRRAGIPNLMIRGDGAVLGWFVVEKLVRSHTFIGGEGVGQQIAFEAIFARVPFPAFDLYSALWRATGPAGLG